MRILKLVGVIVAVLAFAAIATATASATETLWLWLPGATGTKFTGKSAKATLQIKGSGTITCKESSAEGELTGEQTLVSDSTHFGSNCTAGGLPANSLGEAVGVILVHLELHDCKLSNDLDGLTMTFLPLHIEVPSTKLLILVEGALVASISPEGKTATTYSLGVNQKEGKQELENCEGGPKGGYTLTASLDGGEPKQAAEEAKEGTISWTSINQEAMV